MSIEQQSSRSPFPEGYFEARTRFSDLAVHCGWEVESHNRPPSSLANLFTDVATVGPKDARRLLLVTGGLHGIEGFFASAIQFHLLSMMGEERAQEEGIRIVCVHALNPYGYAKLRRVDEENIDLNRNFVPTLEDYTGVPELYEALNTFLNPSGWPKLEVPFKAQAYAKTMKYGIEKLKEAIAHGQYEYPKGLFFGGNSPSSTFRFVEGEISKWAQNIPEILHIDLHTGLGESDNYQLFIDHELTETQRSHMRMVFGNRISSLEGPDREYISNGSIAKWVHNHFPDRDVISICAEFGTHDPVSVLGALRAENAAHHHCEPESDEQTEAKEHLKEMFLPKSSEWRTQALKNGIGIMNRAIHEWALAPPTVGPATWIEEPPEETAQIAIEPGPDVDVAEEPEPRTEASDEME